MKCGSNKSWIIGSVIGWKKVERFTKIVKYPIVSIQCNQCGKHSSVTTSNSKKDIKGNVLKILETFPLCPCSTTLPPLIDKPTDTDPESCLRWVKSLPQNQSPDIKRYLNSIEVEGDHLIWKGPTTLSLRVNGIHYRIYGKKALVNILKGHSLVSIFQESESNKYNIINLASCGVANCIYPPHQKVLNTTPLTTSTTWDHLIKKEGDHLIYTGPKYIKSLQNNGKPTTLRGDLFVYRQILQKLGLPLFNETKKVRIVPLCDHPACIAPSHVKVDPLNKPNSIEIDFLKEKSHE